MPTDRPLPTSSPSSASSYETELTSAPAPKASTRPTQVSGHLRASPSSAPITSDEPPAAPEQGRSHRPYGIADGWSQIVGVVDEHEHLPDARQLQHPLDRPAAAHDREVVAVVARELVLAQELVERRHVDEREPAQVEHDVAHAVASGSSRRSRGDLRNGDEIELAALRHKRGRRA